MYNHARNSKPLLSLGHVIAKCTTLAYLLFVAVFHWCNDSAVVAVLPSNDVTQLTRTH